MRKSLPVLLTPLAARFRCSACGDCCRLPWDIHADAGADGAIRRALAGSGHPWAAVLSAEQALEPLADPRPDAVSRLRKRLDGSCVFLDADSLCYLHKHFGPEVKPATCRTYPFRPVLRPGAVIAPGSLSCRTMRDNLAETEGPPAAALVPAQGEELTALAALPYDRYSPGAYAKLTPGREIRIDALAQAEELLAALLVDARLALPERLLGMRLFVQALVDLPGKPRVGPKAVRPAYEAALGADLSSLQRRAGALLPDPARHLALLGQLVSRMAASGGAEVARRQALQLGGALNLPEAARAAVAASIYAVRDTLARPEHCALLCTFLLERLRASNITMRWGLVSTVQAVICGAALSRAFACGRAGERQRAATREDLLGAIEEVDMLFFHNLTALELLAAGQLCDLSTAEVLALPPLPPSEPTRSQRASISALSR